MDLDRKQQLEMAALERDLKGAEEVLKKGYLKFITPRVLLFMVLFTPLFALIHRTGETQSSTLSDWLWYACAGFSSGFAGATAEYLVWHHTRNKNVKLLEKKKQQVPTEVKQEIN